MADGGAANQAAFIFKTGKRVTSQVLGNAVIIGTRSTCDLVLAGKVDPKEPQRFPDPVAKEEHCRISHDGDGFWIEDLGSATGTYLNGVRVEGRTFLGDAAAVVVGSSRLLTSTSDQGGRRVLEVELKAHAFHIVMRDRKGEFLSDTDRMARDEVAFGRQPALRGAVWGAVLVAAIAVPFTFMDGVKRAVLVPGPLCQSHDILFSGSEVPAGFSEASSMTREDLDRAREVGCQACHLPPGGTPMSRCARCHRKFLEEHHPRVATPDPKPDPEKLKVAYGEDACVNCHREHRGSDARQDGFIPGLDKVAASCDICHAGTEIQQQGYKPRAAAPTPAMEHRSDYIPLKFSHRQHADIDCEACHRRHPIGAALVSREVADRACKDHEPVAFETCVKCHAADQPRRETSWKRWWPKGEDKYWRLAWHGSKDRSKCEQCHEQVSMPGRRKVVRAEVPAVEYADFKARYVLQLRTHADHFQSREEECGTCHQAGIPKARTETGFFWHAVHMAESVVPLGPDEMLASSRECLVCHSDRSISTALKSVQDGLFRFVPTSCGQCHREDRNGPSLRLEASPPLREPPNLVEREDFPHKYHLDFSKDSLKAGCFSCHEFIVPQGSIAVTAVPVTLPVAKNCASAGCHEEHDNIAGGSCRSCHFLRVGDSSLYFGKLGLRAWPAVNAFNHSSMGHDEIGCNVCHPAGTGDLETDLYVAVDTRSIPIPHEGFPACRRCHLEKRQRFHWW